MELTKTSILEAYDRGVKLSAGPVVNHRHDREGRACALGALENGIEAKRLFKCRMSESLFYIEMLPSQPPIWLLEHPGASKNGGNGNVYRGNILGDTLASVFNVTGSFAEARAWLDKELTRLVDEGRIEP